jgi:hypothetical protein
MSKKIDKRSFQHLLPDLNPFGCPSYASGHHVHWIQALHSANKSEVAAQTWSGQIIAVDGELLTVRKADGSLSRFRNHDPARLVVILEHFGIDVTVNDQYAILRAGITRTGAFCISVRADSGEPLEPCLTVGLPSNPSNPADQQVDAGFRANAWFSAPTASVTKSRRTR